MESHDYYARINGKDYPIAWGFSIMEELGETLDSGSITIPHIFEIIPLKPYDDVIIHDYKPNVSPSKGGLPNRPLGKVFHPEEGHFYKHMVVSSYTREKVNLADERSKVDDDGKKYFSRVYNYAIQLKSETSKLETVQMPNKTITQPTSVSSNGESERLSANFKFNGLKLTLPYGMDNSSRGKSVALIDETEELLKSHHITLQAFINDEDLPTADYSTFLTMPATATGEETITLPDWSVSGVTTMGEEYDEGIISRYYFDIDDWYDKKVHHPTKHWIVVDLEKDSYFKYASRSSIISYIKRYLEGYVDSSADGIVNSSLKDESGNPIGEEIYDIDGYQVVGRDIVSSDSMSVIRVVFPSKKASYIIYLYCEPEIVQLHRRLVKTDVLIGEVNVFGMTDNTNGTTKPTKNDEFLCSWGTPTNPFTIGTNDTATSKGALSAFEAMRQAIELYSPYIKSKGSASSDVWTYRRKFSLGDDVRALFSSVMAPENQWNCPNLRDYLTRIMYVKDCIPVVHDGVINCMNLSKRGVVPFDDSKGLFGIENYAMDGNSYCDRLIRTYNDGLSKDNIVKCVERIGFKNSDSPTLTLSGLRLEFAHPIYRITKILMCHYNKMKAGENEYYGVIKHDITPLVILNSQRNRLSENWASLHTAKPSSIKELAKFKYATIGYDIGARQISGWGEKYTYPENFFWKGTRTVIENIYTFAIATNPYGSTSFSIYSALQKLAGAESVDAKTEEFVTGADITRYATKSKTSTGSGYKQSYSVEISDTLKSISFNSANSYGDAFSNYTLKLKSMFFIVEYEGYVSASVMASKDFHDGDVVSRDNASSSLSFVESDGANQKEKVNRLGNAIVTQPVRYSNRDDIEELAQVWDGYSLPDEENESEGSIDLSDRAKEHDDEVLYQRRMTFEKDFVQVAYTFCRNYVLRNYFTSVFAKRRPFALASYEESVERQENKTIQLLFSPDSARYQSYSTVANYDLGNLIETILSFYESTKYDEDGYATIPNGIDFSYYMVFPSKNFEYNGQCGVFAAECQKFTSGNSACFAVSMTDNVSAGVFISDWNPTLGSYIGNLMSARADMILNGKNAFTLTEADVRASNLLTGSKQDWLMFPVDPETGELYSMRFGVGFKRNDFYAVDSPADLDGYDLASYQMLPLIDAVVFSPDLSEITYFGSKDMLLGQRYLRGLGYPRIRLKKDDGSYASNATAYSVDFSSEDKTFDYTSLMTQESSVDYLGGKIIFQDGDGATVSTNRQEVREFLSAKFVGREIEASEETDSCVFKDGKERISVTMQVEPISEDNRVLFSDRMMKLSDAIGGSEKRYIDLDLGKQIRAIVGMTIRKFEYQKKYDISDQHYDFHTYSTASIPAIMICIPNGGVVSNIAINKTFAWTGSSSYSVEIKTLNGLNSEGDLVADCVIKCSAVDSVASASVVFKKYDETVGYISGRLGLSTFSREHVLYGNALESGYTAYYMVEDAFFLTSASYQTAFDDEGYFAQNESSPGYTGASSSSNKAGSLVKFGNGSFADSPLDQGTVYSGREETFGFSMIANQSSTYVYTWLPVATYDYFKSAIVIAKFSETFKQKNLFWVKAPLMASRELAYETRQSIDESEFDAIEISGGDIKSVELSLVAEYTLSANKGSINLTELNIKDAIERVNGAFPDSEWEDVRMESISLDSWRARGEQDEDVQSVTLNRNADGTFNLIGSIGRLFLEYEERDIQASIGIRASATRKYAYPISVENDGRGMYRLKITLPTPLSGERSLRLYHKEGAEYHFVFGANLGAKADAGKSADVIYPSNDEGNVYYIYVSVLDDRSKTVIDAITGDPTYKVVNWLDDEHKGKTPYNACVKKG